MIQTLLDVDESRWAATTPRHVFTLGTNPSAFAEVDSDGHIPISRAVGHGASLSVVQAIFECDSNSAIAWRDREFEGTLLHLAVCNNAQPVVQFLVRQHPAFLSCCTRGGATVSDVAKAACCARLDLLHMKSRFMDDMADLHTNPFPLVPKPHNFGAPLSKCLSAHASTHVGIGPAGIFGTSPIDASAIDNHL